jgi:8-oxo-dGTP diphosphatase
MTETTSTMNSAQFRVAVSALLFDEHRVLLARRRDIDWWNLPGGGMELGETVEQTVKREVLEETGLEVEVGQLVGVYSKPQKQEVVLTFLCQKVGGMLTETEESRECCYFAPNDLPVNTLPKHRQRIQDALLGQERAVVRNQLSSTEEDQRLP